MARVGPERYMGKEKVLGKYKNLFVGAGEISWRILLFQ
jgi:hypothetical protein